jgi:hypothetical protein
MIGQIDISQWSKDAIFENCMDAAHEISVKYMVDIGSDIAKLYTMTRCAAMRMTNFVRRTAKSYVGGKPLSRRADEIAILSANGFASYKRMTTLQSSCQLRDSQTD